MGPFAYVVLRIEGDYAVLQRTDVDSEDEKLVARALLPPEIMEGRHLHYECFEYSMVY